MAKPSTRAYSRYTLEAASLLGNLIREARIEQKLSMQELADRAGISRGLLQRIEKGDTQCALGAAFEVAAIVGVTLFDSDHRQLASRNRQLQDKLSLLPASVRKPAAPVDDDF